MKINDLTASFMLREATRCKQVADDLFTTWCRLEQLAAQLKDEPPMFDKDMEFISRETNTAVRIGGILEQLLQHSRSYESSMRIALDIEDDDE